MTQLDRIEQKLDDVLTLMRAQAGTAPATGHSTTTEGARFAPGTGTLGSSHPDAPGAAVIPMDPEQRRQVLERARAERATESRRDHPTSPA